MFATAKALNEKDKELYRILLAPWGGGDFGKDESEVTASDVRRRALGDDPTVNDIVGLKGALAEEAGFGIGFGLEYEIVE